MSCNCLFEYIYFYYNTLMKMSIIIPILVIFVILILIVYYFWFIKNDNDINKDIPYHFLHEHDITIVDLLKKMSENYGRFPAFKYKNINKNNSTDDEWNIITYYDYYKTSSDLAERILYFLGPHPRIAILSSNRPEWIFMHIGTMMAKGISIGLYPTASSDNCSYVINHSCVDMLVIEDMAQLSKLINIKMPTVKILLILDEFNIKIDKKDNGKFDEKNNNNADDDINENIKNINPNILIIPYKCFIDRTIGNYKTNTTIEIAKPYPEDIATIIYTSGTTGDPKGVVITHKNIISSIKGCVNVIQSNANINIYIQERFISYLPLNHIAAQMLDIYMPLAAVGTVYFADKDALKNSLQRFLKDIKPTIFMGVPRVWEKIMEQIKDKQQNPENLLNKLFGNKIIVKKIGLDKCKFCITAAAPISLQVRTFFNNLGIELCDVYGMSETTGPISMAVPGCSKGVGIPIVDIKIDKKTDEILVRGESIFNAYYKNKNATIEALNKNWFKTGDTGYIDRDGSLYITGRIKDIIITAGGENISPLPIENLLLQELNAIDKLFDYVVVIGDQRKFLSVLLLPTNKYHDNNDMKKIIETAIKNTNNKTPNNTSTIKKYLVLIDERFEINDCLTPTLKIKRKFINDKYKNEIDKLYY